MIWDHKDILVAVWSAIIDAVDSTYWINQFLEEEVGWRSW